MAEPSQLRPAKLSKDALVKVQAAEKKLGSKVILVAYEQPVVPASLDPKQLDTLQDLESQLGLCLVAYRKPE